MQKKQTNNFKTPASPFNSNDSKPQSAQASPSPQNQTNSANLPSPVVSAQPPVVQNPTSMDIVQPTAPKPPTEPVNSPKPVDMRPVNIKPPVLKVSESGDQEHTVNLRD
jgi:hypothetical protein